MHLSEPSGEVMPLSQGVQEVAPGEEEKVLGVQGVQEVEFSSVLKLPAAQGSHFSPSSESFWPGLQVGGGGAVHLLDPGSEWVPSSQPVQLEAPSREKVSLGHCEHLYWFSLSVKVPAGQGLQSWLCSGQR